jgi:hypothetical protein
MMAATESRVAAYWTLPARGALLGLCGAIVAVAGLHWPLENQSRRGLALFLALTACVYPGALLAQSVPLAAAVAETLVGAVVFACAWLAFPFGSIWLTIGYALHGGWDWLHHVHLVPTRVSAWFPPACAVFDFVIAAYALAVT